MTAPEPPPDRTGLWLVVLVIGTMVTWAAIANVLGGEVGFAAGCLCGLSAACVVWRDRISYDLLSNVGLVGIPLLVVGLSLS